MSSQFDLVLNSVASALGNASCIKCLCSEPNSDETKFAKCWQIIMDHMCHVQQQSSLGGNPLLVVLNSFVKSHHKNHIASTKTLLVMSIVLWKRINMKIDATFAVNPVLIAKIMRKILFIALEKFKNDFIKTVPTDKNNQRFIKTSRHFKQSQNSFYWNLKSNPAFFSDLFHGLCRGNDSYAQLVYKIVEFFASNEMAINFDDCLLLVADEGPMRASECPEIEFNIVNGVCIEVAKEINFNGVVNALVVDASLCHNFAHLGFNKDIEMERYGEAIESNISEKENWATRVMEILKRNKIEILLASGSVDRNLMEKCDYEGVRIISNIKRATFEAIKRHFRCHVLVYLEDFSEIFRFPCVLNSQNLGGNYLNVSRFEDSFMDNDREMAVSVLVRSRVKQLADLHADALRHCLKRVQNVCASHQFIDGCGRSERNLSSLIEIVKLDDLGEFDSEDSELYFDLVKEALANSFMDFFGIVSANCCGDDEMKMFDDVTSKFAAWKSAVEIVEVLLNSENVLIDF